MKKNNLVIYLFLVLPALLLQSCLKDQEDVFDSSSSARMEEYLNKAKTVLMNSEQGWILDYYPHANRIYGGYAYTIKFTKNAAEIRYEREPGKKETCLYSMKTNNGPELSFDTYSPMMHFFATPSSDLYEALGGDFEFVIDSIGNDRIKLHGKRSQNVMYMRKLTDTAADYQEKVIDMGDTFYLAGSDGTIGGKSVHFDFDVVSRQIKIATENGAVETAYNYTDKGIRLYEPLVINGTEVSELTYDESKMTLAAANVDLNKGWQSPQSVVDVIQSIGSDDKAFSRSYDNIKHLSEFKFETDADWLTFIKSGDKLTVETTSNATGEIRSAVVNVVNGNYSASFTVTQCEVTDILGDYSFSYLNKDDERIEVPAKLTLAGEAVRLTFQEDGFDTPFALPLRFDQGRGALVLSGGYIGKFKNYNMIASFLFAGGSYVTFSNKESISAPFQRNDEQGVFAAFAGKVSNTDIEAIIIWASNKTEPKNFNDTEGYLCWLTSPVLVKKAAGGAKEWVPSIGKSPKRSNREFPASIKRVK